MKRLVVELTDRCNLRCAHCYSGRHGAKHELDLEGFLALLPEAKSQGVSEISFTGGEPTLYSRFAEAIDRSTAAGLRFSLVSNGWAFERASAVILHNLPAFMGVTFSMDGATEAVHDRQRGADSFRRLMDSIALCRRLGLEFSLNFVVTARSRHQLAEVAALASSLGARGLRYISFIPTDQADCESLDLPLAEWDIVLAELLVLKATSAIPIGISPGFPSTELLPCHSLAGAELNLDWRGQLGLCCHLSGIAPTPRSTRLADLKAGQEAVPYSAMNQQVEAQRVGLIKRRLDASSSASAALSGEDRLACRDCMRQLNLLPPKRQASALPTAQSPLHALETR